MISAAFGLEIIALCFIFLLSSIWSEENVRFGYVLVPLMAGFFWWSGFLPFGYLTTVIPLLIFMGVISFMKSQLKLKWGFGGTSGGILFKLVFFLIMMQMAIGFINGLGMFNSNMAVTPSNAYTGYNLTTANETFQSASTGINIIEMATGAVQMGWMLFTILWSMLSAVFLIYPLLVTTFGIPANLSLLLQAGIYVVYGLELINMVFRPSKSAEV